MKLNRRSFIKRVAAAAIAASCPALPAFGEKNGGQRLGVCAISYRLRWPKVDRGQGTIEETLKLVEHCRNVGLAGVQMQIPLNPDLVAALRQKSEACGLYIEGQIPLPPLESDVPVFEARVRAAKEAGARIIRTACLSGRRYETFSTSEAFREFARRAEQSLKLAEPIVRKHQVGLAVENHKDWRVPELLGLMEHLSSAHIGICVDTGNSIALLEDPMAVVQAYAPFAMAVHLKDMGVQECEKGFLLSEVPLGQGFLDLPAVVATLRKARPELQFSLEMITRNPLVVPCLAKPYWATLENVPAAQLAGALAMVRANPPRQPLPVVDQLSLAEKVEAEDEFVRGSLAHARKQLQL